MNFIWFMTMTVKFNVPNYSVVMVNGVKQAVEQIAARIQGAARRIAPVDTGFYQRSIQASVDWDKGTAEVVANAEYSAVLEYKPNSKSGSTPYATMRTAAYMVIPEIKQEVLKDIKKGL